MALTDGARRFLDERRFAVLATINADGSPQQTVMWFQLRGDSIMMNTAAGRLKALNVRRDPRVSICVEDEYRYVSIAGRVVVIDDHDTTQADIYSLARRYNPDFKDGDYPGFATERRLTLLMSIDKAVINGLD
ncbi:MAG TPA: PPOX class F420-dependent oxidoreductase [Thermomicrobiales bacterium]|nr:PPOX class F420-dependent oxidoreductase [Thermomicrobiales bacterium]